jgi:hypothetical protein
MATVGMAVGVVGQYNFRYNPKLGRGGEEAHTEGQISLDQVPFLSYLSAGSPTNARLIWYLLPQLAIFFLEDATTIFIWCMTDTFDASNVVGLINVITTITSAAIIVGLLIYATVAFFRSDFGTDYAEERGVGCGNFFSCKENYSVWGEGASRTFLLLVLGSLTIVTFFGYVAIGEIAFSGNGSVSEGIVMAVNVFYGIGCTLGVYILMMIRGAVMLQWVNMPCSDKYDIECEFCMADDACCCDDACTCNLEGCCTGQCWCKGS